MSYIFFDESGDLGFNFEKQKTSKCFVITCLFVVNKRPIEKIISKIFREFVPQQRRRHCGCLHAYKETPKTRCKVLNLLCEKDVSVLAIYLNKRKVYTKLHDEKQVLYNYVVNILLDRIYTKKLIPLDSPIALIASRRETNKFFNQNFKNYLENQMNAHHQLKIKIDIKSPSAEKCLQVVDMVCWSIFRKIEHGDESYYHLIKQKIVEESPLFR